MSQGRSINLLRGWPSTSLLPAAAISKAAQSVLANPSIANPGLLYGPDEGHGPLREALSVWLQKFYRPSRGITKERITITGGASQNLGCMLQVFTDPVYTRNIWIVAPAYMLAFRVFEDNGFANKLRAVPEDDQGVNVEYLRHELAKSEATARSEANLTPNLKPARPYSKYYRHVIYCVPTFSNPSSRSMTLDRRRELVRCARDFDALIIADDVYDHLQWPVDPQQVKTPLETALLPRMVDIDAALDGGAERDGADGFGNAMSNGTFSKICGPGVRVGWVEGSPKFAFGVSQTGTTRSGGAPSQLTSTYMTKLVQDGYMDELIFRTLQPAYASRYQTMLHAIEEHLVPLGVTLPQADRATVGGYFVWITLPRSIQASTLAQRCKADENVIIAGGRLFEVPKDTSVEFDDCVRLCFSWEDEEMIAEGVERMARALKTMLQDGGAMKSGDADEKSAAHAFW